MFGGLAERTVPLDRLRDHEPVGFSPELWAHLVAVGAPGMAVPEAAGGAGATLLDLALAVEALGRHLAPAPLIEHAVTARLLARADALSPDVLDGSRLATLALRPVRDGRARLVPAGAVATTVVAFDGEHLVVVDTEPGPHVPNLASAPLADRDLTDAERARIGLAGAGPAPPGGRRVARAHRGRARRPRAGRARDRGAVRDRARAVRCPHRVLPEPAAHPGRRERRARRRATPRPQGGVGPRRAPRRRGRARGHGVPVRGRTGAACLRPSAALPRWLRVHGGVRHPALLPARQGLGERARRAGARVRRGSPTCATDRSRPTAG